MLFKKQPKIGREAMLRSRPARNDSLEWKKTEKDEVAITLKRAETLKARVLSKIFYVPDQRTIVLDQIGSQVWEMCDGKTTVEKMIRRLSEEHKLNLKEAEVSLVSYLQSLGKKSLVGFLVDKKDLPRSRKGGSASGKAWGA